MASSYEELTRTSPSRIKRWSHRSRFRTALQLACSRPFRRVLDYGAGDGHLLDLLAHRMDAELWAFEPSLDIIPDMNRFKLVRRVADLPPGPFDLIFCLEVLEHLDRQRLGEALTNLRMLLAQEGRAVISLPIETGFAGLAKRAVRRAVGDGNPCRIADENGYIASHTGFDYRAVLTALTEHGFRLRTKAYSPLPWLGAPLNSQIHLLLSA